MSALQIANVLEKSKVGTTVQQSASDWLEELLQAPVPLLLLNTGQRETPQLARSLHNAAQLLLQRQGPWGHTTASKLHKDLHTYGEQALQAWEDGTLLLTDLDELSSPDQTKLLQLLQQSQMITHGHVLLILHGQQTSIKQTTQRLLHTLCPFSVQLPPLYQRPGDIDRLSCTFVQEALRGTTTPIEGFSLEATAHLHRAVLQTQRSSDELFDFIQMLVDRANRERLPLHNGYIVAWPTVRMLEDHWDYRLNQQDTLYEEGVECDFQDRLFSASIEHAACRSGFSKSLIELQCQLLQQMIEELPEHQRNYQGLTSRVDQLQWMGMKLLSQARTQAELRDFFGFGGKGKIPKATAKLKFDQYDLEHYGYRSTDPLPWELNPNEQERTLPSSHKPAAPAQVEPSVTPPTTHAEAPPRDIVQVEGELAETLFWRHQDLFTVLASDALSCQQIATLMNVEPDKARADLEELTRHGFLTREGNAYLLHGDDVYYKHSHSRLRCLEENLLRYLDASFQPQDCGVIDNWFLRLPDEGLPLLRQEVLQPFIHQQFLSLSDNQAPLAADAPYQKRMYALMLLGTHRLSPLVHGRLPLEQRVLYYFREASLQRADRQQKQQAICLCATQMLGQDQIKTASQQIQILRKQLRNYLPQGRGNKPNFNLTLCFAEVPLSFYRDLQSTPVEQHNPCYLQNQSIPSTWMKE